MAICRLTVFTYLLADVSSVSVYAVGRVQSGGGKGWILFDLICICLFVHYCQSIEFMAHVRKFGVRIGGSFKKSNHAVTSDGVHVPMDMERIGNEPVANVV